MTTFLSTLRVARARRSSTVEAVEETTFCDTCGQVCTADCRSAAHLELMRSRALLAAAIR